MEKEELIKKNKQAYEMFVKATNEISKLLKDKDTVEKSLIEKIKEIYAEWKTKKEN